MPNPVGRPQIGPAINVRFDRELLASIDAAAADLGISRAQWIRVAVDDKLTIDRAELAAFVEWVLDGGGAADNMEIRRIIEKPDAYEDWLAIFRSGGSMDDVDELEEAGDR